MGPAYGSQAAHLGGGERLHRQPWVVQVQDGPARGVGVPGRPVGRSSGQRHPQTVGPRLGIMLLVEFCCQENS
jgi:hypothetical protein